MKKQLIESSLKLLAEERGVLNITRAEVCARAGVPDGAFTAIMEESFTDCIKRLGIVPDADVEITRKRIDPEFRQGNILDTAIELAKTKGYSRITRDDVAKAANVSPGLITHYFTTIERLRRAVLREAVKRGVLEIVAQGLANKDAIAIGAPRELRHSAALLIARL